MFDVLVWILLGISAGCITGLIPGIHPNLLSTILLGLSISHGFDPLLTSVFLICAGITNSFVSFIPSILFGAPESAEALSVLPGHRMLLRGYGYEAIRLTVLGGFYAGLLSLAIFPFYFVFSVVYPSIKIFIPFLLIFVLVWIIITEKSLKNMFISLVIIIFTGIMGIKLIDYDVFFPVFTGFFGLPLLFLSWKNQTALPEIITFEQEKFREWKGVKAGLLSGIISGFLPGVGASQLATIAQELLGEKNERNFLVAIGAITTVDVMLSFFAIYFISNPRSGVAQAIFKLLGNFSEDILLFFIFVSLFTISTSTILTLIFARKLIFVLRNLNYGRLSLFMFCFLLFLVFLLSGIKGLLLCLSCFFLGLIVNILGVKRTSLMGFLIIPTILYYLSLL